MARQSLLVAAALLLMLLPTAEGGASNVPGTTLGLISLSEYPSAVCNDGSWFLGFDSTAASRLCFQARRAATTGARGVIVACG